MLKKLLVLIALLGVGGGLWWWQSQPAAAAADMPVAQLPDTLTPLAYQIDWQIDPDQERFQGQVSIRAQLNSSSQRLWLHGQGLHMNKLEVRSADGTAHAARYQEQGDTGVALIELNEPLPAQTITLQFAYDAAFDKTLAGIYKVKDGERNYAFSQMEAISARKAFPSFDEPRFKVPFDISLTVRADHAAIANSAELRRETLADGRQKIQFTTTKPLPTYLLAVAVGEFDVVEGPAIPASALRADAIPLRAIATKGKGDKLGYALQNTARIVDGLEQYFGVAYPYDKLDILAVPDFEAGAMENAGAITYREQLLLIDEHSSFEDKRAYFSVHTHELAHQWFGNLVTMPWWNDIWLNEAFASWLENKISTKVGSDLEFELLNQKDAARAMNSDTLKSMRQIRQPIDSNSEISNAFDGITYAKGSAVIAMFEQFVGADKFQQGVQRYMQKHAFGSATAEDFIAAISEAAVEPRLPAAFTSFLTQVGIPNVDLQWQCTDGKIDAILKQSRYVPVGSEASREQQWQIPVCVTAYTDGMARKHCTLLSDVQQNWQIEQAQCPQTLMPNGDGAGYYRFSLNKDQWQDLLQNIAQMNLNEAYVASNNFGAALRSGSVDVNHYLQQVSPIVNHAHGDVSSQPMGQLDFIKDYVVAPQDAQKMQRYYQALYQQKFAHSGFAKKPGESGRDTLMRARVLGFLAETAKDEQVRAPLRAMASRYIGFNGDNALHPDLIDPDLIDSALVVASQDLGEPFFRALQTQFSASEDGAVRGRLLTAIALNHDPKLAQEARDMVTDLNLRTNERVDILFSQISDPKLANDAYQWVKTKYDILRPLLPEGVQKHVPSVGGRFCSVEQAQELQNYFAPKMASMPGAQRSLNNTLESINLCAAFVNAQPALLWEPLATTNDPS